MSNLRPRRSRPAARPIWSVSAGDPRAQASGAPIRLSDLSHGEQALVRAFRRWVAGKAHHAAAWDAVAGVFGGRDGRAVMGGLIRLVEGMRGGARRRILHHAQCCPCLAADEIRLLTLVGAAAAGRLDRAAAYACDLLGLDPLAGAGQEVGSALAVEARGLALAMATQDAAPAERAGISFAVCAEEGRPKEAVH
ncbi:MAG: hypothetical protein RIB45_11665 [Marivibrio sp.]|uniref:hypothetical protein n=1 Tax=Marivibrio sp. TaxID=2039719 RepID=UPI0032F05466